MSQSSSNIPIIDVLIVGAGPVGLFFANEMQTYGCTFRIIDKNTEPSTHSKAFGIMARTLEALDNRNLVEPFFAQAKIVNYAEFHAGGKPIAHITTVGNNESPYPYPIFLPQVHTERFLADALRKASGNDSIVERSINLVSYQEDETEDVIVATLARVDDPDRTEIVKARYIVGCDGVHSTVRKTKSDWTFQGHSFKSSWALADLTIESDYIKNDRLTLIVHPEGPVALFPFGTPERTFRVVASLGDFGYDDNTEVTHGIQDAHHQHSNYQPQDLTLDELRELVDRRAAPEKLVLTDPTWLSSFRINERMANGYRRGRAFIAGDAAHCHSPAGAQGMNMGLQDAHNLAWKIAFVVQGKVKDTDLLLESYSTERVPIARRVLSFTTNMTRIVSKQGIFASLVRHHLFPWVASHSQVQSKMRENMLGTKIAYPSSPLNHPTPSILRQVQQRNSWFWFLGSSQSQHLIEPGEHMPDGMLKLPRIHPGRDTLTLYDVVRGTTTHTLLLFASGHGVTRVKNPLVGKVLGIAGRYRSTITATVIGFKNRIDYQDFNDVKESVEKTYVEQVPMLHERFGVPKNSQAVVVVRPDLYVAFSATEEEVESGELEKFLGGYLVEDSH